MLKKAAIILGVVLVLLGLLGNSPVFTPNGMLLGLFAVNAAHNTFHVVSGVIGVLAGWTGTHAARLFFQVFALIYGILVIHGLIVGQGIVLGGMANNLADTVLHTIATAGAVYFGFFCPSYIKRKPVA